MKVLFPTSVFAALVCLLLVSPGRSCAPAMRKNGYVAIAGESAVILWDEKTKTQSFIRRATFETKEPYFGFLVPSPTRPSLTAVPDELFQSLEDWTKPEVITKRRYRRASIFPGAKKDAAAAGVEVLEQKRVAGYDAAVIKATDSRKFKDWLEERGYVTRPDLEKWLEGYIKQDWIITAFQIAKTDKEQPGLSTQAVRMTFHTERPFYPYAEPADQRTEEAHGRRLLRIFFIGSVRMEGRLDDATTAWPGKVAWSNPLADEQRETILAYLGKEEKVSLPATARLTVFDDSSSPRPGVADLFFSVAKDQSTLVRPPLVRYEVIEYGLPEPLFSFLIFLGGLFVVLLVGCYVARKRIPSAVWFLVIVGVGLFLGGCLFWGLLAGGLLPALS